MVDDVSRDRHWWELALGVLLVLAGVVVLGNAVVATVVSVLLLGWMLLGAGVVGLVVAVLRLGRDGFWSAAVGGGLMLVLGLFVLRHTGAAAVTLTLLAGIVFLVGGILRVAEAVQEPRHRGTLVLAGAMSTVLGLVVLLDIFSASLQLFGVLLGVQLLTDGVTMLLVGRIQPVVRSAPAALGTP